MVSPFCFLVGAEWVVLTLALLLLKKSIIRDQEGRAQLKFKARCVIN